MNASLQIQHARPVVRWRRHPVVKVLRNPVTMLGLLLVVVWLFCGVFAPLVAPYNPDQPNVSAALQAPGIHHLFGTDNYGRDVFSRVVYGARISIPTSLVAVAISFGIGVPLGAVAGYYGGTVSAVIMRGMDMLLAFPSLVLAMAIAAAMGPGLRSAMIAVGIVGVPEYARLMYGQTMSLRSREFVEASATFGSTNRAIVMKHILPNALAPLIVNATIGLGFAILTAASLSFLGLGVQPPTAEWGDMISEGSQYIVTGDWWMVTFPGLAIATSTLGFNLLGDGLRDILDPRQSSE
ncbi:ABC transporter permease [Alicyclobacillus macrosporangiidus]|uniref:Peptide/nickel transport system permease protein n=1 Tax=Alicyclobacillus macrosporangiidus TaxID=392015 RepID=A0A1I7LA17_9BACL|nr:ABC transporter permease [Alicyclobacillus macrosporangiidus]SFV06334.1 peptide/nickel transport system permease protein [Alicyclobacillus macrosporangiidus]